MDIPDSLYRYLIDFLEVPHKAFGNMPPCPFAQKERISKRIQAHALSMDRQSPCDRLHDLIVEFSQHAHFKTLLVYDPRSELSAEEIEEVGKRIMDRHTTMLVIALVEEKSMFYDA